MSRGRVSVVVPLVRVHDAHLAGLMEQISEEADLIDTVFICRSSDRLSNLSHLQENINFLENRYQLDIELLSTHRHQSAGQNRNAGWKNSASEFTAFIDADDCYAPGRLGTMLEVATTHKSDLVLHDFIVPTGPTFVFPIDGWGFGDLIHTERLRHATFPNGRKRSREGTSPGDTNIEVPQNPKNRQGVHHGHLMVRTETRNNYRFGNLYPGEDGQLCRDILWDNGAVVYIPARLSAYFPQHSAGNSGSYLSRAKQKILRGTRNSQWPQIQER